jgi:NAD(P)H-hydrate epimerase
MKLFTCQQIAEIDRLTIKLEPVSSIDLMERAAQRLTDWIFLNIRSDHSFYIFVGPGNNGGDALAVARMLSENNYNCTVFLADFGRELKGDAAINQARLIEQNKVILKKINSEDSIPEIPAEVVILDGLFGSGINKPLAGLSKIIVQKLNLEQSDQYRYRVQS